MAMLSIPRAYKKYRREFHRYGLLLAAPLVLGVVLFFCVRTVTVGQMKQAGEYEVSRFAAHAHSIVHELDMVGDALLADSTLRRFVSDPDGDTDPFDIVHTIRAHTADSGSVSSAYLIVPGHSRVYGEVAYYTYEGLDAILASTIGEGVEALETPDILGWHILNSNYADPYYVAEYPGTDAKLLITLDKIRFIRVLQETNAVVCAMFNDDFNISSLLTASPATDWQDEGAVSDLVDQQVKCFYCRQDGYTYMVALSTRSYNAPLRMILAVFAIYLVLVSLFGSIYLFRVSRRRYEEAAAMIDGLPQAVAEDPTYEEIVNAMRQSLERYKEQHTNRMRFERRNLLLQLLTGTRVDITPGFLQEIGLGRAQYGFFVALIHFTDGPGLLPDAEIRSNIDVTCSALYSALCQAAGEYMDIAVTHLERNYVLVISVRSDVVTGEDVRYILTEMAQACESGYGCTVTGFVSLRAGAPEELPGAYKSAAALYSFSGSIGSEAAILLETDMESNADVLMKGDFIKQLQILSSTLQLEKYDLVPKQVAAILEKHISGLGSRYALADDRIATITGVLGEFAVSSRLSEENISRYVERLRNAKSVAQVQAAADELCGQLAACSVQDGSSDLVSRACAFIAENISNPDLSVPDVSGAMGVSVQHLARLFRRKLDSTVVEQINSTRIERARQLLLEGGMTVNAIAREVGYNNNVTFSRNFHRCVGMSPSEYRTVNKK